MKKTCTQDTPPSIANGEDVGFLDIVRVHILAAAHMGEGADAVAQGCCAFEIHRLGGLFHFLCEPLLQVAPFPRRKSAASSASS
jgi:hypothetical protein